MRAARFSRAGAGSSIRRLALENLATHLSINDCDYTSRKM